ncbi:flagellar hook-basal body complex protein FliE [Desulfitobacterium metallireducens]|uniref:Flagellar hook-basal body complex protein FliE n=1 Tax=Desulfitobacterium metallireducens DSM 15288 TaxID=871968 RepID=W0EAA4_9FIRM|nr:flagellar hook-basal body complex protein FliE [Desulfitobacterium metallireducens]AHF07790.1 flagellar hook-basal body protein FliE [Desulfitobacterium metallireducens DSM 15288]
MAIAPIPPMNLLNPVNAVQNSQVNPVSSAGNGTAKAGSDFGQFLTDALNQVDALQKNAGAASLGLATGQIQDVHTVMIAEQKASLALNMTVQVRNKVIESYQEIMRMQI